MFFCNDCGEGYVTDNVGDRTPMCDPCRAEMGLGPRAIEHQWELPKPAVPYAGPICVHTVGSIGDTMCGIKLPHNRDRKTLVYCTRFDDNHREREEVPARALRAGDVTCEVCDHACMIEFLAG